MARRPTPKQTLDALIELFVPEIRAAFEAAVSDVVNNAILADVVKAIEAGDIEAAFVALGFSPAAMRPLTAALEAAYERGGVMTGGTFPKYLNTTSGRAVFRFDVRNSRAEAWLRDHSAQLVTRIEDETRTNVRNVLQRGMTDGRNPRAVALDLVGRIDPATQKRVGGIIGLTTGQENWVASARAKLSTLDNAYFNMELRDKRFDGTVAKAINSGTPLNAETIDKLVTRYKDNALKYRAETIARTEALQSLNASEYEAIKQAVATGAVEASAVRRHWDAAGDRRTRPTHMLMDAKYAKVGVGLEEPFVSPSGARMLHPGDTSLGAGASEIANCRCRVRTSIDWFADLSDDDDVPVKPDRTAANRKLDDEAKSQVVTNGKRDKVEHAVAYDADSGEKLGATRGTKTGVGFSDVMREAMETPGRNIVVHHNHPASSSFSPQDIHMVVDKPGLSSLWAHGHNGASYLAEKGKLPINMPTIRQIFDGVQNQMQEAIYARKLTVDDAQMLHAHIATLIYDARGHIKYTARLPKAMMDAIARNQGFIDEQLKRYVL